MGGLANALMTTRRLLPDPEHLCREPFEASRSRNAVSSAFQSSAKSRVMLGVFCREPGGRPGEPGFTLVRNFFSLP